MRAPYVHNDDSQLQLRDSSGPFACRYDNGLTMGMQDTDHKLEIGTGNDSVNCKPQDEKYNLPWYLLDSCTYVIL